MSYESKETLQKIWEVVKQIIGFIFIAIIGTIKVIYEIVMIFDKDHQNKRRIQFEYDQKKEWVERSTPNDIFNDWRIKMSGITVESTQEERVIQKMQNRQHERITDILSEEEIEILILWLLRILGVFD